MAGRLSRLRYAEPGAVNVKVTNQLSLRRLRSPRVWSHAERSYPRLVLIAFWREDATTRHSFHRPWRPDRLEGDVDHGTNCLFELMIGVGAGSASYLLDN